MDVLASIAQHISLTPNEEARFIRALVKKKYKHRQYALHEGAVCHHSTFVVSGLLRAYSVDDNGFEHILQFAPAGWWVADMYSLLSGLPGHLNIDALEDTEVWLLSKTEQEALYRDVPKFERYFRILTENSLVAFRQRVLDNLELSATQRYEKFCEVYPMLMDSLPQKHLASYIGVTPQFLSRIRKNSQE